MRLTLKISLATILWTAAIALAIAFTAEGDDAVLIWAIVTVAAAALTSAMVAGDYIAAEASRYIVGKIVAERQATMERSLSAVRDITKAREDRIVSRVQSANDAALRRLAAEIADAVRQNEPTRLH